MVSREFRGQLGARKLLLFGAALLLVHLTAHAGEPEAFQGPVAELGSCPVEENAFAPGPVSLQRCDAGGRGSRSCDSNEGLNPMGVQDGCGISCRDGYYACCKRGNLFRNPSCVCIRVPTWPYTPSQLLLRAGRGGAR
jgi:hypothetical protein